MLFFNRKLNQVENIVAMLELWYKELSKFPREHKDFWRARFIFHILLTTLMVCLVTASLNIVFSNINFAIVEAAGGAISIGIYAWFRHSQNLLIAAWLTTVHLTLLCISFMFAVYGGSHSFVWASIIPPSAFLLLGRNWGTFFTMVVMGCCLYIAYGLHVNQVSHTFTLGSIFNVVFVSLALIAIFRFYEDTRAYAYNELNRNMEKNKYLSETDKLTGLFNRQKLDNHLRRLINRQTKANDLSMLIVDIDHFKSINDQQGHLVGDTVLRDFAILLRSAMRTNDFVARWGGEEFVVLLPQTSLQKGLEMAERLRLLVKQQPIAGLEISICVGISSFILGDDSSSMLQRADDALYEAKNKGRDRVIAMVNNMFRSAETVV